MKRMLLLLVALFVFSSCGKVARETRSPETLVTLICERFSLADGYAYTEKTIEDAMLSRMFSGMRTEDLCYVRRMGIYLAKGFSREEVIIFELYDKAHGDAVKRLLAYRAEQKENAVLFQNGVYLYLICTNQNQEIKAYLLE